MKTGIKYYGTIVIALFIAFFFVLPAALANAEKKDSAIVVLKYIGNIKNQPVFQLDLDNAGQDEITITISDPYGDVLYSENVRVKTFTRKFQLNTEEIGDDVLRVEVKTNNNRRPEVYEISRSTRFIQEAVVSKL